MLLLLSRLTHTHHCVQPTNQWPSHRRPGPLPAKPAHAAALGQDVRAAHAPVQQRWQQAHGSEGGGGAAAAEWEWGHSCEQWEQRAGERWGHSSSRARRQQQWPSQQQRCGLGFMGWAFLEKD